MDYPDRLMIALAFAGSLLLAVPVGCTLEALPEDDDASGTGDDDQAGADDDASSDDDDDAGPADADGDGWDSTVDCDDGDPLLNLDDLDNDGWTTCDGDCHDTNGALNLDDDDGDGWSTCDGDCDDWSSAVHPGASESCNGTDDDCDGSTDEDVTTTYYHDGDGDGYGDPSDATQACALPGGYASNSQDCNDSSSSIHPGATELCDGQDNNCDGTALSSLSDDGYETNDSFGQATTTDCEITYSFQICRDESGTSDYDYIDLITSGMDAVIVTNSSGSTLYLYLYDESQVYQEEAHSASSSWSHSWDIYQDSAYMRVHVASGSACSCSGYTLYFTGHC